MDKKEQQNLVEQEEMEGVEETTLLIRKSRTEIVSKTTEFAAFDFEVSDAVSEIMSNGYKLHSELVQNGGENGEKTLAEEQETEKLNGVLEKEPESINGEQESSKLVGVLEKEPEAINGEESPAEEQEISKLDGVLEKESEGINGEETPAEEKEISKLGGDLEEEAEAINGEEKSKNLVFHDNVEGADFTFTYLKETKIVKEPESKEFDSSTLYHRYGGEIRTESEAFELINEDDLEVKDLDVERVIRDQTTHDLFCPNCSSCITKRVILRKRKRKIRISDEEFKGKTPRTERGPELAHGDGVTDDAQITLTDEEKRELERERERGREPAVYRCLSCFTCFIPTGDGLKCLPIKDWFASMFNKPGPVVEQGSISQTVLQRGEPSTDQGGQPSFSQKPRSPASVSEARVESHTWESGDETAPLLNQEPSANGNVANGVENFDQTNTIGNTVGPSDSYTGDQFKEPKSSLAAHNNHECDQSVTTLPTRTPGSKLKPAIDAIVFTHGRKFPIPANKGPSTLEESNEVQMPNQTEAEGNEASISATNVDDKLNFSVFIPPKEDGFTATITSDTVHEYNTADSISSNNGHVHHHEGSEHIFTRTGIIFSNEPPKVDNGPVVNNGAAPVVNNGAVAADTEITIHPSGTPSRTELENQVIASDSARTEYEIEVIKSIVYGGLAESITSLSVVASAAGGGAATLNVLALGAANLIGGLFIICHNLWDLRYHQLDHVSNQINEQQDRYKELLGRRQSFVLHFVLAIISYITFGLVPPLVYGFSFRESDDRQLKLAVVGPISIFCILILAIAKAYTQKRPKPYMKTIATYLVLGFMVSGVSYVAGELVERLLNELGLFQTSSVPNVEMKPTGSGWATY